MGDEAERSIEDGMNGPTSDELLEREHQRVLHKTADAKIESALEDALGGRDIVNYADGLAENDEGFQRAAHEHAITLPAPDDLKLGTLREFIDAGITPFNTDIQRSSREAERGGSMQAVPKADTTLKAAAPPPRSRLAGVVKGRLEKPIRIVLYATDGLGKSTFASHAPAPIFIGAEDGTAQLDVARMPDVRSWNDIIDSVDELAAAEHEYKTLVLDTADWAEPMCWDHVCTLAKKPDIESFGYGKGYQAALDQWRILLSKFERARDRRGMNVIVLAHSVVRTFKNPEDVGDYDRYEMALNGKASGLLKQWADVVLFGAYETVTREVDKSGRTKGISTGARLIHTQRRASWDAKNRYDLPETLPLDWHTFIEAVAAHRPADPAQLKTRIAALLERATEDVRNRVTAALERVGDNAAELARIADKLAAQIQIQETNQ